MSSIDADLQTVMELAPLYSRLPSPAMRARDEVCQRLRHDLSQELAGMSGAPLGLDLDVAVGGRQASYSPVAWVRVYSRAHSPNATAGIYLAYLFAADGSRVYLSLQQGSSEIRSGQMRPVNDPHTLLARGAAARSEIRDLIESPLAAGTTIRMDLAWRSLSSVGSYSKQRIRNYEHANILAVEYQSGAIPAAGTLRGDFHRILVLLTALYGSPVPPEDTARRPEPDGPLGPDELDTARVQGLLREAAIRRAVEVYAEDRAESDLHMFGWSVDRVGPLKLGYDLECTNKEGARLHVEVKGTQSLGEEVLLTRNEADHSGPESACGAGHALYVLSDVGVSDADGITCTGGRPKWVWPWTAERAALTPTVYAYTVPADNGEDARRS